MDFSRFIQNNFQNNFSPFSSHPHASSSSENSSINSKPVSLSKIKNSKTIPFFWHCRVSTFYNCFPQPKRSSQVLNVILTQSFGLQGHPQSYHILYKKGNNILGKVQGISFQFPLQNETQTVSLFVDQEDKGDLMKDLQRFTSVLQRKYIVQKQFHEKYKAIKRIGKGVTACVYSSLCLSDKSQVAIKSFKKQVYFTQDNCNGKKGFLKQFKILTQISCKYLSKLLGVYESDHSIYIVLELLDRTLYSYLQRFSFPQTTQCRRMLYQLLIGLRYLHKKNIMHRDIKLENIMIRGAGKENVEPVIVDFGLAEYTNATEFVYIRCGTPGYVAPEIINLSRQEKTQIKYDKACDIFSLGVIFHILLLGKTVFEGEDMRSVVESNKQCNIDYEFKNYSRLSPEIKDLLSGMLRKQPKNRYTVEQSMNHVFFREEKAQFANQVHLMDKENFCKENLKTEIEMIKE